MGCYRDEPERSVWGVGTGGLEAGKIGGGTVREVERERAGGGNSQKEEVGELGRKFATMLNISQSKRAKGRKSRKMGRESRKQGTGRTPSVPLPSRFSKSVIQVTLSSCTRLKEKLARMLDVRKEC